MIIQIKVKPNSPKTSLIKLSETEYQAFLTEPAEKNRANRQLINLLAKQLKIDHKNILITNPTSSKKRIKISQT